MNRKFYRFNKLLFVVVVLYFSTVLLSVFVVANSSSIRLAFQHEILVAYFLIFLFSYFLIFSHQQLFHF